MKLLELGMPRTTIKRHQLSCTLFQTYGKEILYTDSKNRGIRVPKKQLGRLESIIWVLYVRNLIYKTIYDKLNNVRNLRSDLQHTKRAIDKPEKVIDQALEVLKFLKGKYYNI